MPIGADQRTEKEIAGGHGIWSNRGAIASQAFAEEYGNVGPEPADNPDPQSDETRWLSRGLLEACLHYLKSTRKGYGLRVAAFEFTYLRILEALGEALERGVDVQIVYKDTTKGGMTKGANEKAIEAAGLPQRANGRQVLFPRAHTVSPQIPHNKFIVRLDTEKNPVAVWTGSTNFTPSGFLGQTNVGHLIESQYRCR